MDGQIELVKLLLDAGALPSLRDFHSMSAKFFTNHVSPTVSTAKRRIINMLEAYCPSLTILSRKQVRKYKIDVSRLPQVFQ